MTRTASNRLWGLLVLAVAASGVPARAEAIVGPASGRFGDAATKESPDFQRHVLPLLGRLGCNGRACHGSFQGRGGFRLSLFGYDFKQDHEALTKSAKPRVDLKDPAASKILEKPTMQIPHEGGERMKLDTWQYRLLLRWIQEGAKTSAESHALDRIEVQPAELRFKKPGETAEVKVIARWTDGRVEDVTCISRFRSNDDSIADVNEDGIVVCKSKGDTHIVAFYDNGVATVPALLPVSDKAANYPEVAAPTKIDELVVAKLRRLGIVPSDLCNDAEFLRRVTLDMTGTLPTPKEVKDFLANGGANKRAKKIDQLLNSSGYAAWWSTRLCDWTGNSGRFIEKQFGIDQAQQWYDWIHRRVKDNVPYDKLVEGIVVAVSRKPGKNYETYAKEMTSYVAPGTKADFAKNECMPYFWMRRDARKPEEAALAFAYSFLGVRLQCAQCHKHPFDQWTQQDYQQFTAFFTRVSYGIAPDARETHKKMQEELGLGKKAGGKLAKQIPELIKEGKTLPWSEIFIAKAGQEGKGIKKGKGGKPQPAGRVITPKLLGGEEVVTTKYSDPRQPILDWMRDADNPYFARAFVNRVWAGYFNVGIVEPPDDQNLANPPSNGPLLDYLTKGFIEHSFDMKWLHREIANSSTYQRSWKPNPTNELDTRNFSRAVPRRLPAEVAYDALVSATAGDQELIERAKKIDGRVIAAANVNPRPTKGLNSNYALRVFGKPDRATSCDCERSNDPNLLQSIFLHNDRDVQALMNRGGSWLAETSQKYRVAFQTEAAPNPKSNGKGKDKTATKPAKAAAKSAGANPEDVKQRLASDLDRVQKRLQKAIKAGQKEEVAKLEDRLGILKNPLAKLGDKPAGKRKPGADGKPPVDAKPGPAVAKQAVPPPSAPPKDQLVREAYLRTLSRLPTAQELARAKQHLVQSPNVVAGLSDLLWALLNTKEFIVNH